MPPANVRPAAALLLVKAKVWVEPSVPRTIAASNNWLLITAPFIVTLPPLSNVSV